MSKHISRRSRRLQSVLHCVFESLESRQLLATIYTTNPDTLTGFRYDACCGSFTNPRPEVSSNSGISTDPVRYADGIPIVRGDDLLSSGFGTTWGHTRTWSPTAGLGPNGRHWDIVQMPQLIEDNGGDTMILVGSAVNQRWFNKIDGQWVPRESLLNQLGAGSGVVIETDTAGNQTEFYDFSASPTEIRGKFKTYRDAAGNQINTTYSGAQLTEVTRSFTTGTVTLKESFLYTYIASGQPNEGLLSNVKLRRKTWDTSLGQTETSQSYTTIRQVDYAYYNTGDSHGGLNDLKTATIKDGAGTALETSYYRYYTGYYYTSNPGYAGHLKYVLDGKAYARLAAAVSDPLTATDQEVKDHAQYYFEYDEQNRVSIQVVPAMGSSSSSAGMAKQKFEYFDNPNSDPNPYLIDTNVWRRKTVEYMPDSTESWIDNDRNLVFMDEIGNPMLTVYQDVDSNGDVVQEWRTFRQYDAFGRLILVANPSAVTGYNENYNQLVDYDGGNYEYLADNAGLITLTDYYSSTTATETTAGGVADYYKGTSVKRGESGTAIVQDQVKYTRRIANNITIYPLAESTVYANTDGSGARTTAYDYSWFTGTLRPSQIITSYPTITTGQNGSGTAATQTTVYDTYGRATWVKDAASFIHAYEYDPATGALAKQIVDVDTSQTSNEPSGWSTPTGGGLHLITSMEVDGLGRTTKLTEPRGNVTYTVYKDADHEVRVYEGWTGSDTTGPTKVIKENWAQGYVDVMSMTAAPQVSANKPTGGESLAGYRSLVRSYTNIGRQITHVDRYYAFVDGLPDDDYYRTEYGYNERGYRTRIELPSGTIERTVYDALGRPVSTWVGTDDTGATDYNPAGSGSPNNMVKVSESVYDEGSAGDGNLTRVIEYPGGSADSRVALMAYDWRNRLVATKLGAKLASGSHDPNNESTATQRAFFYDDLNNLGEVTASYQYDGDQVALTSTNGVPDKPSASLLRAKTTREYDNLGRTFAVHAFSVNPSDGTVSSSSLNASFWYDPRGYILKTAQPGGLVTKYATDGAGRTKSVFLSDGGGDSGWADADDLTGDIVVEQSHYGYDANGNVIFTATKQRFHDAGTTTGELGTPTTAPYARIYYTESFYDDADRLSASVDLGTNGGTVLTSRPDSSVPTRSSTKLVTSYQYSDSSENWVQVTDPRGLATVSIYSAVGQIIWYKEAFDPNQTADNYNRFTSYSYDNGGNLLSITAHLPNSAYQITGYSYGVQASGGSAINSNDLLARISYPNKTTGAASTSASDQQSFTYNALGQTLTTKDQNETTHTFAYDVLGRIVSDTMQLKESNPQNVDGTTVKLGYGYDTAGRAELFTSFGANDVVLNQVQNVYNGLGQLITQYQSHSGAVNINSTPKVQYAYSEMAGGANHSRLTRMVYPDGRSVEFGYASGLDNSISRLIHIADNAGGTAQIKLETYSYLGLDTVVQRDRPQPDTLLSYVGGSTGEGGDKYVGLDRFGRVVDQHWSNTDGATDQFRYGYDVNGNRLYKENAVQTNLSELYHANGSTNGYDPLDRLTAFARGTLNANKDTITEQTPDRSQSWDLSPTGNWESLTTDGTQVSRNHNAQNQITSVGSSNLVYDNNGNTTTDQAGKTYVYDAWNRMISVSGSPGKSYSYDALGRRITETVSSTTTDLYYSEQWQVLEERTGGKVAAQNVWSPIYVDAMILRDHRRANADGSLTDLNSDFSGDGKLLTDSSLGNQSGYATAVQADGKIVTVGASVLRFNPDGTLDTSFDSDGIVSGLSGRCVAIQSDGKILVGSNTTNAFTVTRLNANGSVDTSFDTDGIGSVAVPGGYMYAMAIQPDGKIVLTGEWQTYDGTDFTLGQAVARLNADGSVDSNFGSQGAVLTDIWTGFAWDWPIALAILPSGKIMVAGYGYDGIDLRVQITRHLSNGSLDTSFDDDGIVVEDTTSGEFALGLAMIPDGSAVTIVAELDIDDLPFMGFFRYNDDGSPDTSFSGDGQAVISSPLSGFASAMQVDGRILVLGYDYSLARFIPDPADGFKLDTSFGNNGLVTGSGPDGDAWGLAVGLDGQVVAVGTQNLSGGGSRLGVACYNAVVRQYVQQDANFNVTSLTDAAGVVTERYLYDPYGAVTVLDEDWSEDADNTSDQGQVYLFQGGRLDGTSGLYYFRNRDLSPTLGRWMSKDPIGYVDGMSLYQHVGTNPIASLDPEGLRQSTTTRSLRAGARAVQRTSGTLTRVGARTTRVAPGPYKIVGGVVAAIGIGAGIGYNIGNGIGNRILNRPIYLPPLPVPVRPPTATPQPQPQPQPQPSPNPTETPGPTTQPAPTTQPTPGQPQPVPKATSGPTTQPSGPQTNQPSTTQPTQPGGPTIGNNPRPSSGQRVNTDLPGGEAAAKAKFDELTGGTSRIDPETGHLVGENGVRLRFDEVDGRYRIDRPGSPPETIHFND